MYTVETGKPNLPSDLTESGLIFETVPFVNPTSLEWRFTSRSVYRYAYVRVDIITN